MRASYQIELRSFRLPTNRPFATARGSMGVRRGWLIRLCSGDREGFGEATPLPGWTESVTDCKQALERARSMLPAGNSISDLLEHMETTPAARHGLSLAWHDLRARRENQPLYRMLGARESVNSIPVNAVVGDGSVEKTLETVRQFHAKGYECVKIKVGSRSPERDRDRLRAVARETEGGLLWRADANGSWAEDQVSEALNSLSLDRLEYLEQPIAPDQLDGLARLRDDFPVAVDETLIHHRVEEILARGAADVFILKPMVMGGPERCLTAARRILDRGGDVVTTTTIDGVVARCGAIHLAACLNRSRAQGLATGHLLERDLAPDPAPVRGGRIRVPQKPGLGTRGGWE